MLPNRLPMFVAWLSQRGVPALPARLVVAAVLLAALSPARAESPAQVAGLKAVHRAGQTFLTWNDPADAFGDKSVTYAQLREQTSPLRFRVYRHTKPIDAASLKQAKLLAEVAPLSGFNLNSWSFERLVNQALFRDEQDGALRRQDHFRGWSMDSAQGGKLVIPRFAIEDTKPLPPGTALYVHSATEDEKPDAEGVRFARAGIRAWYAVTAVADGQENTQLGPGNVLGEAVWELSAPWQPVEQPDPGKFAFDFGGGRRYFVTWVAPPLAPRPMYFNWSVLVPEGAKVESPVELYFHSPGMSYARPHTKLIKDSIQIAPHDFPFSGWYGFNDALLTGGDPAKGVVRPYTIRRISAFMDWAARKFPMSRQRVMAVGGDGAALYTLYRPEAISLVAITRFHELQLDKKSAKAFEECWGPSSPDIKDEAGRAEWAWGELDQILCGQKLPNVAQKNAATNPATQPTAAYPGNKLNLPLFVCGGASWGRDPGYARGRGRFYYALQACRQGLCAGWSWNHTLKPPDKYSGTWNGLMVLNTTAFPAITYSSADNESEAAGQCNASYSWKDVADEADRFEVTVAGPASRFDLTPRRVSQFKVSPGQKLRWEAVSTGIPRGAKEPVKSNGEASADENGLVTLQHLELPRDTPLKVTIRRAE